MRSLEMRYRDLVEEVERVDHAKVSADQLTELHRRLDQLDYELRTTVAHGCVASSSPGSAKWRRKN
ncbi:hypothetical protein AB0M12_04520 [Nocardia vinacea]|uniref:hypothetical protein n=1 Tax=Nocardia vinacea TaxID=96468 RepID=UPI00343B74E9